MKRVISAHMGTTVRVQNRDDECPFTSLQQTPVLALCVLTAEVNRPSRP